MIERDESNLERIYQTGRADMKKDLEKLKKAKQETGIEIAAFCTGFISLVDESKRQEYIDSLIRTIEIAKELEVSPATIAVALKNLEKEQYIVRTSKEGDNRVKDVLLTEKGQKLVEDSREYFNLVDSEMYQGFSEQEKKQFVDFLKRIYHNMERLSNKQAERKKRKDG